MNKQKRDKPYAHHQEFSFILPVQFLLLCRLLQVEPRKVLYQFMCNLAHESYANGTDQKFTAKEYFLSCGYGLELYTDGEIEQLFDELDNIAALWPKGGPMKLDGNMICHSFPFSHLPWGNKSKSFMKALPLQSTHYLYWLQSYEQWLQIIGYSDSAIKNLPAHVRELLHYLESRHIHHITLVDNQHINQFVGYVNHRSNTTREGALSSSSINTIINAVNSFTRYLNTTGKFVLDYTVERAEDDVKVPTVLTIQEIKSLYDATFLPHRENSQAMGQRDRAIIAIFYGCGLRKMEGTQLSLDDIDLNRKLVFVRRGKGGKQRYVPIASKHAEDIPNSSFSFELPAYWIYVRCE